MFNRRFVAAVLATAVLATAPFAASASFKGNNFEAFVVKSTGKQYKEFVENKKATLKVRPNEEYSILVRNPLPVRVAVAVTIDGLNSIDGKRTSPKNAQKWLIEPNAYIKIQGWQTSKKTLRKFLFTEQPESFAEWREEKDGKAFTRNLGVIGVAWFWNSKELEDALRGPQPFVEDEAVSAAEPASAADYSRSAKASAAAPAAKKAESRAGTGMGRQQTNLVTSVEFTADAGMYSVKDVLKIFYVFAKEPPEPMPFVDEDEDEGRFTPDMYK